MFLGETQPNTLTCFSLNSFGAQTQLKVDFIMVNMAIPIDIAFDNVYTVILGSFNAPIPIPTPTLLCYI